MVKTNVHFPTDITLLFDAIRKVITLISCQCKKYGITEWRKSGYNIRKIKQLVRKIQNLKRSKSNDPEKKAKKENEIVKAHQELIDFVMKFYEKAKETIIKLKNKRNKNSKKLEEIEKYMEHVSKQVDLIERRVIKSEVIPHNEKIFSIFEEHTEWISKGKAGVPQELGIRVCILEDQFKFILHHQVMKGLTDDKVPVSMVKNTKEKFPDISICSFDTGFYTPENKVNLEKELDKIILTKRGKLSSKEQEVENSKEFIQHKNHHSGIESAISALDNQGLDICPDRGLYGFERYVAIGILARNIQILGNIIQKREIKIQRRRERLRLSRKKRYLAA